MKLSYCQETMQCAMSTLTLTQTVTLTKTLMQMTLTLLNVTLCESINACTLKITSWLFKCQCKYAITTTCHTYSTAETKILLREIIVKWDRKCELCVPATCIVKLNYQYTTFTTLLSVFDGTMQYDFYFRFQLTVSRLLLTCT